MWDDFMKKRILSMLLAFAVFVAALAFPAGAVTGMSIMGGFSGTSTDTGKAIAFSDAKNLISATKSGALSSYTFMPKPDLQLYTEDSRIEIDSAQLAAWKKEARSIPKSQSDYFGVFLPKAWGSSGCCSCG
jgi:hypothetical protein